MGGGLPTLTQAGEKAGMSAEHIRISKMFAPGAQRFEDLLLPMFAPPDPIVFPEVKPATPPPTISEVQEAGDEARKRSLRGRGRRGTFLTGDVTPDLTPTTGKKRLLG